MTKYAIIVAGGKGSRFGSDIPKQFLLLSGVPVLMHTIKKFADCDAKTLVVLPKTQIPYWEELCNKHKFDIYHTVVHGGDSRFCSVKNALNEISPLHGDIIAVHDGVRPLVDTVTIQNAYRIAAEKGSAIPSTEVTDSTRQLDEDGWSHPLLRTSLRSVQTPQTFDAILLKTAYNVPFSEEFTDDASVVEKTGHKITLFDGNKNNIKITHPLDLLIAEKLLKNE